METGYSVSKIAAPPTVSLSDAAIHNLTGPSLNEPSAPPNLLITPPKNLTTISVLPISETFNNNKNPTNTTEIKRKEETVFTNHSSLPPLRHTFKSGNNE